MVGNAEVTVEREGEGEEEESAAQLLVSCSLPPVLFLVCTASVCHQSLRVREGGVADTTHRSAAAAKEGSKERERERR